jgi:D-glucuronyl C5-epimerase C-terminus
VTRTTAHSRRAAAVIAAGVALALPAVAHATAAQDAVLARKGITRAVARHWVKPPDAQRYRAAVTRALRDAKTLPRLRADVIASQLSQVTPLWDSYTSPRALALFSQLETNLDYFESHVLPTTSTDVTDDEGVVYRWFPRLGLEFHPLANFSTLNNVASAGDSDATRTLADALVARAIPRGGRLIWEYQFPFGGGRPPWASGMAQAVAAQALARSGALLEDPQLAADAVRAFASVPPLLLSLPSGPWVRLYGFSSGVVLNAQLQTILSLLEYVKATQDEAAANLTQQLATTAEVLFPRFDTGDWSRYQLGGGYAPREYQKFVTDLLAKLAKQTQDPFWVATSQRFHAYYYDPPQVSQPAPPPTIWPQPADGWLDTAPITITLSMRASVTLAVAGKVSTYKLTAGTRTINWVPPVGIAQGTYPAQVAVTSYAGKKATYSLAPVVVRWDTTPPPITASLSGTTLTWQANDSGTPWLALHVDLADPSGVNPPQTVDLGQQPTSGSAVLTVPPGTWQATLQATNSAGLTTPYQLGLVSGSAAGGA